MSTKIEMEKKRLLESSYRSGFDRSSYGSAVSGTSKQDRDSYKNGSTKLRKRPLSDLFRYANNGDVALMIFGSFFSFIHGAGWPILSIVFGSMTDAFLRAQSARIFDVGTAQLVQGSETIEYFKLSNSSVDEISNASADRSIDDDKLTAITREEFLTVMGDYTLYYVYVGILMFFTSYAQIACWQTACERQILKIRKGFLHAILRQEISWFDKQQSGQLTTRLSDDLERIKEGTGDKVSLFIQFASTFVSGFVVGFAYSWRLTLVMLSIAPLLALSAGIVAKFIATATVKEQQKYAKAGAIAEEVLSCVRTVSAFNGQEREVMRYEMALGEGKVVGIRKYVYMGIGMSSMYLLMYASYGLAFWYGSYLILEDIEEISRGTVFTVFFSVMAGSFAVGNASTHFSSIAGAKGAVKTILDVIDEKPTIDPYCTLGRQPATLDGQIEFRNIRFAYPTRRQAMVFRDLNFSVESGETVALVGQSGCGKSTIVNLLLRYYDADHGNILIDKKEILTYNVSYLRQAIGVVNQEPILFDATIEQNVRYGKEQISFEELVEATKMANAHEFIMKLPEGYQTFVGERGIQLSGGQKQRIAIARALARNPKVLLLDEATSALDAESEFAVQEALERATKGRTTIIIAHRLSTIQKADRILVMKHGIIIESGSHNELMDRKGLYHDLVVAQTFEGEDSCSSNDADSEVKNTTDDENAATAASKARQRYRRKRQQNIASTSSAASVARNHRRNTSTDNEFVAGGLQRGISNRSASVYSVASAVLQEKRLRDEIEESRLSKASFLKIVRENRPDWKQMGIGFIGSLINGTIMPAFALFYAEIFSVYSLEGDAMREGALFWALMFVALGGVQAFSFMLAMYCFGKTGENLTMRLRTKAFASLLRQDIAYFDDNRHGTGKICTRLATDAPNVRFAFGGRLGALVTAIISIVAGVAIAFIFGWKLALVVTAMLPIILASGFIDFKLQMVNQTRDTRLMEEAGKVASEAIENIRTVQALTRETTFYNAYCEHLQRPFKECIRQAHFYALAFAFSQCVLFFVYAAAFKFGAFLVGEGDMEPLNVFRVFFAISFCGMSTGQITSFLPDVVKARLSAALLFHMIEYPPQIDNYSNGGLKPELKGSIKFNQVIFSYPSRPTSRVLKGLTFVAAQGRTTAIVGESGCGKSTVISLIERFYDPGHGQVLIDDYDVRTLNIRFMRSHISVVSQEPVLFDCSIRDNIAYGVNTSCSHERIVQAAKIANAHDFIVSLPQGYNTHVGEKGVKLSGGQKQRIAIARAMIKYPKILLLDEATSALDSDSEKIVQEALDRAREGRTCIVVAHRLSTVLNADCILVVKDGKIAEKGTHAELLARKGVYAALVKKQSGLRPE